MSKVPVEPQKLNLTKNWFRLTYAISKKSKMSALWSDTFITWWCCGCLTVYFVSYTLERSKWQELKLKWQQELKQPGNISEMQVSEKGRSHLFLLLNSLLLALLHLLQSFRLKDRPFKISFSRKFLVEIYKILILIYRFHGRGYGLWLMGGPS